MIQNIKNVVVWGSYSRSLKIAPFNKAHTSSY